MSKINERIKEKFHALSNSQKKVAHYILENMEDVGMSSAQKIAIASHVSEATVHRLAQQLDYESFIVMKEEIQTFIRQDYRSLNNLISSTTLKQDDWLNQHFLQEAENIVGTSEALSQDDVHDAATALLNAKRIWVGGWRMSLSVTSYMQYILKYMLGNCSMIPQGETSEYAANIDKEDVVFLCAFPRYDPNTLNIARMAKGKGAHVIAITDSSLSPIYEFASLSLFAKRKSKSFLDSYTAAVSISNAIINDISYIGGERVKANIKKVEDNFVTFNQPFKWNY